MFQYFYHSSPSLLSVVGLPLTAFTLDAASEIVDRIYPQRNKFATGVENKATGDSKLNYSPDLPLHFRKQSFQFGLPFDRGKHGCSHLIEVAS